MEKFELKSSVKQVAISLRLLNRESMNFLCLDIYLSCNPSITNSDFVLFSIFLPISRAP